MSGENFDAFISYSHTDRDFVQKVRSDIERFGRPFWWIRRRRTRIDLDFFRSQLRDEILDGVKRSGALVVFLSPDAARSNWVHSEIRSFVEKDEAAKARVALVLMNGRTPYTDVGSTINDADCAISKEIVHLIAPGDEPRLIDMRSARFELDRSGKATEAYRGQVASVVAAIEGRDRDVIFGQHMREQRNRILFLSSIAAALAALAIFSWTQRDLAEQRRKEAVGVADLITFKIERRLSAIAGAARFREELLQEARDLLDRLGPIDIAEDSLRAAMMVRLRQGDLERDSARVSLAMREYEEACRIARSLAAESTERAGARTDLVECYERLADIDKDMGELERASWSYRRAVDVMQEEPLEVSSHLCPVLTELGEIEKKSGRLPAARENYENAIRACGTFLDANPMSTEGLRNKAFAYDRLGDLDTDMGMSTSAQESYEKSFEIYSTLHDQEPYNAYFRYGLAAGHEKLGDAADRRSESQSAMRHYREAIELLEELANQEPSRVENLRTLAIVHFKLGGVLLREKDGLAEAGEQFQRAAEIATDLQARDATNPEYIRTMGGVHAGLGEIAMSRSDFENARLEFTKQLASSEKAAAMNPQDIERQLDVLISHLNLIQAIFGRGQTKEACTHARAARNIIRRISTDGALAGDERLVVFVAFLESVEPRIKTARCAFTSTASTAMER